MKKVASIFSVLMVAGTMVFATAKNDPAGDASRIAFVKKGTVIRVFYKTEEPSLAKVSIVDSKGRSMHTDYVRSKTGFSRPYNISSLPADTYTVTVSDDKGVRAEEIIVKSAETFNYKVEKIKGEESKYALFIPASNASSVNISIYNQGGDLVYSAIEKLQSDFARVYNMKKVEGEVSFVVTANQ